jgi:hypothetical protein
VNINEFERIEEEALAFAKCAEEGHLIAPVSIDAVPYMYVCDKCGQRIDPTLVDGE